MKTNLELRNGTLQVECRSFNRPLAVRELKKDGYIGTITGYCAVYETESRDMGGWKEIIQRGAFKEALTRGADVRLLYQHDKTKVMARESAGNLRLSEDADGIRFEADLVDTQLNRDALVDIRSGNLNAMSFGMPKSSVVSKFEKRAGGPVRLVSKADMAEISVVTWAAYEDTTLAAREFAVFQAENGEENDERFNHNHGKGGQFASSDDAKGATKEADLASAEALNHSSGKWTPHQKAADLHDAAAALHSKEGNTDQAVKHTLKANEHRVEVMKRQGATSKRSATSELDLLRAKHSAMELRFNHHHGKGGKFAASDAAYSFSDHAAAATANASRAQKGSQDHPGLHRAAATAHSKAATAHDVAASSVMGAKGFTKKEAMVEQQKHAEMGETHRIQAAKHANEAKSASAAAKPTELQAKRARYDAAHEASGVAEKASEATLTHSGKGTQEAVNAHTEASRLHSAAAVAHEEAAKHTTGVTQQQHVESAEEHERTAAGHNALAQKADQRRVGALQKAANAPSKAVANALSQTAHKTSAEGNYQPAGTDKAKNKITAAEHQKAAAAHEAAAKAHAASGNQASAQHHQYLASNHVSRAIEAETAHLPMSHDHKGETYYVTGKNGRDRATGEASQEMSTEGTDKRIWMSSSGKVKED